jgi:hypothetical protein
MATGLSSQLQRKPPEELGGDIGSACSRTSMGASEGDWQTREGAEHRESPGHLDGRATVHTHAGCTQVAGDNWEIAVYQSRPAAARQGAIEILGQTRLFGKSNAGHILHELLTDPTSNIFFRSPINQSCKPFCPELARSQQKTKREETDKQFRAEQTHIER